MPNVLHQDGHHVLHLDMQSYDPPVVFPALHLKCVYGLDGMDISIKCRKGEPFQP